MKAFISFIFLSALAFAETPAYPISHYTTKEGLLSNIVLTFSQDRIGRLWVGTDEGVSIFDGISFTNRTIANGLPNSRINAILQSDTDSGTVWIGTNGGGLCRYSSDSLTTISFSSLAIPNIVSALAEDGKGTLYCGTVDNLFAVDIETDTFHAVPYFSGKEIDWLSSDQSDQSGSITIVSGNSLYTYDGKSVKDLFSVSPTLFGNISSFYHASQNKIIIGTTTGWLIFLDGRTLLKEIHPTDNTISSITGSGDRFYITTPDGLYEMVLPFEHHNNRALTKLLSLPDLHGAMADRDGDLCLINGDNGFSILRSFDVQKISVRHTYSAPNGSSAASDSAGHLWLCADDGLHELWLNGRQQWNHEIHSTVGAFRLRPASIFMKSPGSFILGDWNGNLMQISVDHREGEKSRLSIQQFFASGRILPEAPPLIVFEDSRERIWCSCGGNHGMRVLSLHSKKPIMHLTQSDGIPDNSVRAIAEDGEGTIWLGGYDHGLSSVKTENGKLVFRSYTPQLSVGENEIRSILPLRGHALLIGTRYGGLLKFDGTTFQPLRTSESGLWCSTKTADGTILLGTQRGVQFIRDDTVKTPPVLREFINEPVFSIGTLPDSTVWMTTGDAVIIYRGTKHAYSPPLVWIGSCEIDGEQMHREHLSALPYDKNTLSVQLRTSGIHSGKNLFFQWRFDNESERWSTSSSQRTLTFASLSPGKYSLEIRAIDFDGNVSLHPAELSFTILPPFWRQWWFFILIGLAIAFAAGGIVWFKASQLLEIERLRSRIAGDLHDEIGSGLTRIALLSEVMKRQMEKKIPLKKDLKKMPQLLGTAQTTARQLADALGDVVWSLDGHDISFTQMLQRFTAFAGEVFEAKGITMTLTIDEGSRSANLVQEQLSSFLLFLKEASNNIVRHSGAKHVSIEIRDIGHSLSVSIVDDGKGFVSGSGDGNGLRTMKRRIGRLGGTFEILSVPGSGTTIHAVIPMRMKTA